MKLKLITHHLSLITIVACASVAKSQTNLDAVPNQLPPVAVTQSPTIGGALTQLKEAIFTQNTNWIAEAHGLYAPALGNKYGFGLGYFYQVNTYVMGGLRLEYVDGGFVMPSGNATLQLPLHPLKSLAFLPGWLQGVQTTPFAYAGIGIPLSGAKIGDVTVPGHVRDNNGEPTAILGQGMAITVYSPADGKWNISAVGDRETWSGYNGTQYRFGALFHSHLPEGSIK